MAKKIILFLSAQSGLEGRPVGTYICKAGAFGLDKDIEVEGTQTNEAPVKAMLAAYPDISSIICIVTQKAKDDSLEFFKERIRAFAEEKQIKLADDIFKIIDFSDNETFEEGPLQKILQEITPGSIGKKNTGDEILLETTGGLRDAVMYLLLLSRILTYNRNQTIGASYVDITKKDENGKCQIHDVSELVRMFDLVGGMQELTSFGNVRTLRKYFGEQPKEECIRDLLDALEALNSAILLCRVRAIDSCMERFNTALEATSKCNDPLMSKLIPAFKLIFRDKKLKTKGLIQWCLNANMLQQALTLYVERIPAVIMESVLIRNENTKIIDNGAKYQDQNVAQFMEGFLKSSTIYEKKGIPYEYLDRKRAEYNNAPYAAQIATIEDMSHILPESGYTSAYGIKNIQTIARDYLYIKQLRNTVNHANDSGTENMNGLLEYLEHHNYRKIEDVTVPYIKQVVGEALDHLAPPKKEPKRKK